MFNLFTGLIGLILNIIGLIYFFFIISDTKKDLIQKPFEVGEKDSFFKSDLNDKIIDRKCELTQYLINNPKVEKLGDAFDLNMKSIHSTIVIIAIINASLIVIYIVSNILIIYSEKEKALALFFIVGFLALALSICHLIFSIRLILSFYTGDTHRFIKFLSCENVNKDSFNKYLYVEKFEKDFKFFIIINIITQFIDNIKKAMEKEGNE